MCVFFVCYWYGHHLDLPVLTHSFPTRRSSVLTVFARAFARPRGTLEGFFLFGVFFLVLGIVVVVIILDRRDRGEAAARDRQQAAHFDRPACTLGHAIGKDFDRDAVPHPDLAKFESLFVEQVEGGIQTCEPGAIVP